MKNFIENHLAMTMTLIVVGGAIVAGAWVAHYNQKNVESKINERILSEEKIMLQLATITDSNGADDAILSIASDCSRRTEYEALLNSLGSLSKKELILAQNLSESCGNFYVERKALMVMKLEREFNLYMDFIALIDELKNDSMLNSRSSAWSELVTLEKSRSALITDQNIIQSKIISLLISGSTVGSKDVVQLVRDANDISDLLGVNDLKIDALRATLD